MTVTPTENEAIVAACRAAAEQLLYEYAACADELDAHGVACVLGDARLTSHGGVELSGAEAIERHLTGLFATAQRSRHLITNIRLSVDGTSASTICLYNKWVLNPDPQLDAAGRYHSQFELRDGQWRFAEHRVENMWRR